MPRREQVLDVRIQHPPRQRKRVTGQLQPRLRKGSLLDVLAGLTPLDEPFPDIADDDLLPLDEPNV